MRRSVILHVRTPKELGLAPEHATWRLKSEPWKHMRRMANLVGSGYYIPPEWYNHFRMFPPTQNQFLEEQTLNPFNKNEETQTELDGDAARSELRKEIGMRSRSIAAEGNRYYNVFWVEKAMDKAERTYREHRKRGYTHNDALQKALEEYYEEQTVKKRAHIIQGEEARLSGKFITMREASTMLTALSHLQAVRMAPHQYAELAAATSEEISSAPVKRGRTKKLSKTVSELAPQETPAPDAAAAAAAGDATADAAGKKEGDAPASAASPTTPTPAAEEPSPDLLADLLFEDATSRTVVEAAETPGDSHVKLHEVAQGNTGSNTWYKGGDTPVYSAVPPTKN